MFKETAPKPQEAQNDNFTPFGEITFPDDFPADFTGVAVEGKEADPEKIIELLHDSIWEAPANSATEFFASSNKFDSEEKAFLFLTEEK